jgi:hypothetical protein
MQIRQSSVGEGALELGAQANFLPVWYWHKSELTGYSADATQACVLRQLQERPARERAKSAAELHLPELEFQIEHIMLTMCDGNSGFEERVAR